MFIYGTCLVDVDSCVRWLLCVTYILLVCSDVVCDACEEVTV